MPITSKVDLCNMALGHLGNFGSVSNIDTPEGDKELTFSLWYDISRQTFLKMSMPNFALSRRVVAQLSLTPAFGFTKAYEYPSDCLKLLGIGNVTEKENNYTVEGGVIYTDEDYQSGLPIRFIKDIEDVSKMSPEFKMAFSHYLSGNVALEITQDAQKAKMIQDAVPSRIAALSGLNAQENMPIRKSRSNFKHARSTGHGYYPDKR